MIGCAFLPIDKEKKKILISKRSMNKKYFPGFWEVIGGNLEFGEDFRDCIIREVKEEINCRIKDLQHLHSRAMYLNDLMYITIAYYGELLPSGKTAPTKAGYKFKGYYSNENQEYAESVGQNYGGTQYYDEDMNGVEPWDKTGNTTIYAHWAPATYVVTFDAGSATLPQGIIDGNKDLAIEQRRTS